MTSAIEFIKQGLERNFVFNTLKLKVNEVEKVEALLLEQGSSNTGI